MGYFPLFIELEDKTCLIAGGGKVALRKAEQLLPFGADILVVSPEFEPGFLELESQGQVRLVRRKVSAEDVWGADMVIAATSDSKENAILSAICREKRIPVNVVDVREQCSFLFPSIIKDGPVTVGISTGGSSPALAKHLRQLLACSMPVGVGALASRLMGLRERVKQAFPASAELRGELFSKLLKTGLEHDCRLTEEMAEEIIRERLDKKHE